MSYLYEIIFIVRQDLSATQVETLTKKFTKLIQDYKGKVGKTEYCGLRSLAYMVKKNRKGHYVLMNATSSGEGIAELERLMRINEDVLRFLTVRVKEHEKSPSALLKANRWQEEDRPQSFDRHSSYPKRSYVPHPSEAVGANDLSLEPVEEFSNASKELAPFEVQPELEREV